MTKKFSPKEMIYEGNIEEVLIQKYGCKKGDRNLFDKETGLFPYCLSEFLKETQQKSWERFETHYGEQAINELGLLLARHIGKTGTMTVLKNGVKDIYTGVKFDLAYFKPNSGLNQELEIRYRKNQFHITRQVYFSDNTNESVDCVISLNGIPIFSIELKYKLNKQNYQHAISQYRGRDFNQPLFRNAIAHFAMDENKIFYTTRLKGEQTQFLPFNKGFTNPVNEKGYRTEYFLEEVLQKDCLAEILAKYVKVLTDKAKKPVKNVFPRYHQLDTVRRCVADCLKNGVGKEYLIQHSPGSGKSYTIAWLAHQLSNLYFPNDTPVFDTVLILTDRILLDDQLGNTIEDFQEVPDVVKRSADAGSKGLKNLLNQKVGIIVTTIQKFPNIQDSVHELSGRKFAIIIDEAHSSQGGKYSAGVNITLASGEEEEFSVEDAIIEELRRTAKARNASYFAFTATPKITTLELFGVKLGDGADIRFVPFSVYSMRQAIQEGFILDVLENYITYRQFYNFVKKANEDQSFRSSDLNRAIITYINLHEDSIREKCEIILEHFKKYVLPLQKGTYYPKAMIVTGSQLQAATYKKIMDQVIAAKGDAHRFRTLVAFSSKELPFEGRKVSEEDLNETDASIEKTLETVPEYRFLIVADKYTTGYDEPLMTAMYVNKRLKGAKTVQTLNRLNRIYKNLKHKTFVLDFVNSSRQIKSDFQQFYEETHLSGETDPFDIYGYLDQIRNFHIIDPEHVEKTTELVFSDTDKTQVQKIINSFLDQSEERFSELDDEQQETFRALLKRFLALFNLITQIREIQDTELYKYNLFIYYLADKLKPQNISKKINIKDYVDLQKFGLWKKRSGSLSLKEEVHTFENEGEKPVNPPVEPPLLTIEELIRRFNEEFQNFLGISVADSKDKQIHDFFREPEIIKIQKTILPVNPKKGCIESH